MGKIITLKELVLYHDLLKDHLDQLVEENSTLVLEEDCSKFPIVGKERCLYVDTTNDVIYRWSDANTSYRRLTQDCEEIINNIEIINGIGKI